MEESEEPDIEANDSVIAIVLRGAGRCFFAGHDLGNIAEGETHARPNFQAHVVERQANLPRPMIAVVMATATPARWNSH